MNSGWTSHRLMDVAAVIPSGVDKKSHPDETPVRLCNYLDVYNNDEIDATLPFSPATASAVEIDRCRLQKGDVVVTKDSETPDDIGKPAVVIDNLQDVVCGYHLAILRPNQELTDSRFLGQMFRLPSFRKRLAQVANGAIRFGLTTTALSTIELCLPPLSEQKVVSKILATWDRGIRQLNRLIKIKLQCKRGLMQKLLTGKVRIGTGRLTASLASPSVNHFNGSIGALEVEFDLTGKSFQEGIPALGDCPSGWTNHPFRDIFTLVERPAEVRDDATYQLVTAKRYRGGIVPREQLRGEQIKTKTQFFIASGDFLISKRQIIHGACGTVPDSLDGALVSNEYACLRPNALIEPVFMSYLSHTQYFQKTCFHASVGVALEKMIFRLDQWLKHHVNLPPIEEQKAIANCLSTIEHEILLLAHERYLLKEQKKGLMQKLLTGQVRVKL